MKGPKATGDAAAAADATGFAGPDPGKGAASTTAATGTGTASTTPAITPLFGGDHLLEGAFTLDGASFFSGPDPVVTAAIPSPASPDKQSDADYEKTYGIDKAIKDKKMLPVAGVDGKTFTAVGCAGKKDGKVSFTFDRAFVGDYDYAPAKSAVRGVHVSIAVKLENCGEHKDVKLVQVMRNITKKDGKVVNREPDTDKRKLRSGWDDPKAKSQGWRVDETDKGTSPFYVTGDVYGNNGSSTEASKLRDSPADLTTDTNVGKEFRTCAVSYADGKGTVLACVDWGYFIDDKGAASFYPATPTAHVGATTEVSDAAERWDAIAGNTKANLIK